MPERTRSWRNAIRAAVDREQPVARRLVEIADGHPEQRAGARDGREVAARRRRDEQRGPGVGRERVGAPGERAGQRRGDGHGCAGRQGVEPLVGELEQGERVAAGRREAAATAPRSRAGGPRPAASDSASAAARPPTTSSGSPAERTTDGSSRAASRTTTGSAVRRRAAKHSACADGGSSRWASSTITASGRSSATRLSRLSTAAPTANRSPPDPGSSASAEPSASACGAGMASSWSSTGRRSWSSPPNGTSRSASTPAARSTRMPASATADAASSSSALLPIPASPDSSSVPLSPTRAEATSLLMTCRSRSRPTSTDRV